MLRSFLLVPCLLICLACATPFPFDDLKNGMTAEAVRERFGEPVVSWRGVKQANSFPPKTGQVLSAPPGFITFSTWTYIDEFFGPAMLRDAPPLPDVPMPVRVVLTSYMSVLFFWLCPFGSYGESSVMPINWNCWWVMREPVVLHFEEEKLVRWEWLPNIPIHTVTWQWVDHLHRMEP